MSITLLKFMSDIYFFCICLMRDVLLYYPTLCMSYEFKKEHIMRECEKDCQKAWTIVKIRTSIFNRQYLSHFCMEFFATIA